MRLLRSRARPAHDGWLWLRARREDGVAQAPDCVSLSRNANVTRLVSVEVTGFKRDGIGEGGDSGSNSKANMTEREVGRDYAS